MLRELVNQLTAHEGITKQLKTLHQLLWVQRMNIIRDCAAEVVNIELIYA